MKALLLGGLLPVVAYTVIEEYYGILWGLIAGMVLGLGEIFWEWRTQGKVEALTWGGNGLILILGGVSLFTNEGIWFKLQPTLIEGAMALVLWGSVLAKRPLMMLFMEKALRAKGLELRKDPVVTRAFAGLTVRIGVFLILHAALSAWAALHWSTAAWAMLKGVGFTVSSLVYVMVESLLLRYRFASTK